MHRNFSRYQSKAGLKKYIIWTKLCKICRVNDSCPLLAWAAAALVDVSVTVAAMRLARAALRDLACCSVLLDELVAAHTISEADLACAPVSVR